MWDLMVKKVKGSKLNFLDMESDYGQAGTGL